eukprot:1375091-Rhodomonas_salina.4
MAWERVASMHRLTHSPRNIRGANEGCADVRNEGGEGGEGGGAGPEANPGADIAYDGVISGASERERRSAHLLHLVRSGVSACERAVFCSGLT